MHLSLFGKVAIIILCILVFTWIFVSLGKTGYLPDGVFKDTYESMIVSAHRQYDNLFENPEHLYSKTIGYQNDDTVQLALNKAERKEKMHDRNEKKGTLSRKNANDAAINAFIMGDLYRYNIAPNARAEDKTKAFNKAATYYGKALQRISNFPRSVVKNNTQSTQPPIEQMIDRVEEFYEDYLEQLDNLGVHETQDIDQIRDDIRQARRRQAQDDAQHPMHVPPTQTQRIHGRKRKPKKHTPGTTTKQIEQEEYFEERDIRSSPQNVHDTELTNEMLNMYSKILAENNNEKDNAGPGNYKEPNIDEIRDAIRTHNWDDPNKKSRALKIVNLASAGNTLSQLGDAREDEVLLNVWKRINSSANTENRESLKDSLMDSLADSMDTNWAGEYKEVCIGGRCARMLGSLTLLDAQEEIAAPMKTAEILRNEVFSKSYKILQEQLESQPQEVRDIYNGKISSPTPEQEELGKKFEESTKDKIAETIRSDYPNSKPTVLDNLIKDAQAGV